mmetsp:Transcript_6662/g.17822  ORF Transcript_6662/g.17822 Transcript_6662/m.17822 type:complete len:297 (-) Transcript_6662:623-1513(-)
MCVLLNSDVEQICFLCRLPKRPLPVQEERHLRRPRRQGLPHRDTACQLQSRTGWPSPNCMPTPGGAPHVLSIHLGLELALLLQAIPEGLHYQRHVLGLCVEAHDANAEHLAGCGAQATRNLQVILVHGILDEGHGVHALGHLDGVHCAQPVCIILHKALQAQALQAIPQLVVHFIVAPPHVLQALLSYQCHGLTHRVECGHRACVVVEALAEPAPVVTNQVQVQVVGGRHLLAPLHLVHRLLAEEQGRSTRRAAEALLGARVNGVHAPGIRKQWHAAQAAHRVYQEQRVGLLTDLR